MSRYFNGVSTHLFKRKDIIFEEFEFPCREKVIKVIYDVQVNLHPIKRIRDNTDYASLPLAV